MESVEHGLPTATEIPRFDDGMVNIQELIRIMAEALVNEIMDAQAEDACADGNQRNGYRERTLATSVGVINLRIPKLGRGSYFPEDLLVRYSRVDRAVIAAVSEMVTCGVSTRKVERIAAQMGIDRMSSSQVSRICEALDATIADLQERDLSDNAFPYIWVDATYIRCRDEGHVSSCALVTAIGAGADGYRRLLGLDAIDTESYAGWLAFLRSLRERGADGVVCVTSDAHEGLRRAIEEVFPGAAWQRCIVHLMRNAASLAPTRQKRAAALAILHAVFAERDPGLVRELYHLACREIRSSRRQRPTPWHTSTFPMLTIAVCEPTTFRSAPTASSSDAAAWCRCSRPGNRSSACWAQSSPRWTRAGRPEGGSRKSRLPRPLLRRSQPLLRLRMKGPPRSTQGASLMS